MPVYMDTTEMTDYAKEIVESTYKLPDGSMSSVTLKEKLGIKTIVKGSFSNMPGPDDMTEHANMLVIVPTRNTITANDGEDRYNIVYNISMYYLRKYDTSTEVINDALVEAADLLASQFFISGLRFNDDSPIYKCWISLVDYESDFQGILGSLEVEMDAVHLMWSFEAEK
jgi:hypothetical protein